MGHGDGSLTGDHLACPRVIAFTTLYCSLNSHAIVLSVRLTRMSMREMYLGMDEVCTAYPLRGSQPICKTKGIFLALIMLSP